MAIRQLRLLFFVLLISASVSASIQLPLATLRDQGNTQHCWEYAMSHLLESRLLLRDSVAAVIDIEQDPKYWVDYERMMAIYRTKNTDIYFSSDSEGGWQIEYWDSLLKHGKALHQTEKGNPLPVYPLLQDDYDHLDFIPGPPFTPDPTLPSTEEARQRLMAGFDNDQAAQNYIIDYLNRWHGKPVSETQWFGSSIPLTESAEKILGSDFANAHTTESFVLIKPTSDRDNRWTKYLGERFWGYRYPSNKVRNLIEMSLDARWPVTFDNGGHGLTIIGYEKTSDDTYYAIANSWHGNITWVSSSDLEGELNLVTIYYPTIQSQLPPIPAHYRSTGINFDKRDHVETPPL